MDTYTENEWQGAIASVGRLVDIRNFPNAAAELLLGETPNVYLGHGSRITEKKRLDPKVIPAVVFWTKGPVELLSEHHGLRRVLTAYNESKSVIGIQLTVTGLGGTFLEPGIPSPEETAAGLEKVLKTGLVDPDAVLIRYDPLVNIRCQNGRIITNASTKSFERIVSMFSNIGIKHFSTKFLLLSSVESGKYGHVYERLKDFGLTPLPAEDKEKLIGDLRKVAGLYNALLQTCCVKIEQAIESWPYDEGCLSGHRLTQIGKKRFGEDWNRISNKSRPSRPGCLCTRYWDLSINKGFKRCGSHSAACLYCTSSAKKFGKALVYDMKKEIDEYFSGKDMKKYEFLVSNEF